MLENKVRFFYFVDGLNVNLINFQRDYIWSKSLWIFQLSSIINKAFTLVVLPSSWISFKGLLHNFRWLKNFTCRCDFWILIVIHSPGTFDFVVLIWIVKVRKMCCNRPVHFNEPNVFEHSHDTLVLAKLLIEQCIINLDREDVFMDGNLVFLIFHDFGHLMQSAYTHSNTTFISDNTLINLLQFLSLELIFFVGFVYFVVKCSINLLIFLKENKALHSNLKLGNVGAIRTWRNWQTTHLRQLLIPILTHRQIFF